MSDWFRHEYDEPDCLADGAGTKRGPGGYGGDTIKRKMFQGDVEKHVTGKACVTSNAVDKMRMLALNLGKGSFTGLRRYFINFDSNDDLQLTYSEFRNIVNYFQNDLQKDKTEKIRLNDDEIKRIFIRSSSIKFRDLKREEISAQVRLLDKSEFKDKINLDEFLALLRPPMNLRRTDYVDRVFDFLRANVDNTDITEKYTSHKKTPQQTYMNRDGRGKDRGPLGRFKDEPDQFVNGSDSPEPDHDRKQDDVITLNDIMRRYNVNQNGRYKNGDLTKLGVFVQFMANFKPQLTDSDLKLVLKDENSILEFTIMRSEFREYYTGISQNFEEDNTFETALRSAWPAVFDQHFKKPPKAYQLY